MMSHPDPKTHLLQRGWTEQTDGEGIVMWSLQHELPAGCKRGYWSLDVSLINGKLRVFVSHAFSIDAADVYALSLLAEQTRKSDATSSTIADKSRRVMNTLLLTDDAKLHGSHWLADIPIRVGSPTAEQLRSVQGVRAPITIGPFHAEDAIVLLADVTNDVETWRVYKTADVTGFGCEPSDAAFQVPQRTRVGERTCDTCGTAATKLT